MVKKFHSIDKEKLPHETNLSTLALLSPGSTALCPPPPPQSTITPPHLPSQPEHCIGALESFKGDVRRSH